MWFRYYTMVGWRMPLLFCILRSHVTVSCVWSHHRRAMCHTLFTLLMHWCWETSKLSLPTPSTALYTLSVAFRWSLLNYVSQLFSHCNVLIHSFYIGLCVLMYSTTNLSDLRLNTLSGPTQLQWTHVGGGKTTRCWLMWSINISFVSLLSGSLVSFCCVTRDDY